MRAIPYSTSRENLYHPEIGATVYKPGDRPSHSLLCAEASRLMYKKFEINNDSQQEIVDALRSIGYAFAAASLESTIIVAFRGTEPNLTDIGSDLKTWRTSWPSQASVHAGFASALNAIWGDIDVPSRPVIWPTTYRLITSQPYSVKDTFELQDDFECGVVGSAGPRR